MNYGLIEAQKNKIIEKWGQNIFSKALQELEYYSQKWKLSAFIFVEHYSVNLIFFCISELCGDCVLKIGSNEQDYEFAAECNVLREYNGGRYVKVYESDIDLAARKKIMLIERVIPGEILKNEQSLEKRLAVFAELFKGLHIEPENPELYISYIDFLSNKFNDYLKATDEKEKILIEHRNKAKELYFELSEKYNRKMLLHMDLYYGNIVSDNNGEYKIIDPKGIVGDPIFDTAHHIFIECYNDNVLTRSKNIKGRQPPR